MAFTRYCWIVAAALEAELWKDRVGGAVTLPLCISILDFGPFHFPDGGSDETLVDKRSAGWGTGQNIGTYATLHG